MNMPQATKSSPPRPKSEEDLREYYLEVHVATSCVVDTVEGAMVLMATSIQVSAM
jgi:hypothetical protein